MTKRDVYYIRIAGDLVEVDEIVYYTYYKMDRRERYLVERDNAHGLVSYDALDFEIDFDIEHNPTLSGRCIEKQLIRREVCQILHESIAELAPIDQALLHAVYFEGLSIRQFAKRIGRSQPGLSRRHRNALSKLKELLKQREIFHCYL
jgi:RNA polymerase sigma factor (sigma-70 family)